MNPAEELQRYPSKWALYRRLRNWFWITTIGAVPGLLLAQWVLRKLGIDLGVFLPFLVIMIWAAVGIRLNYLDCPRCGKPMFMRWPRQGFLQQKCVHCGLPKFASPERE